MPNGLPKDSFSGEDFDYERTDEGFALRCGAKDLNREVAHEYAFVPK